MCIVVEQDPEARYRDVLFNNKNVHITHTNIPMVYNRPDTFWELIGQPVVKEYHPIYEPIRSFKDVLWPAPVPAVATPKPTSLCTTSIPYHHCNVGQYY